ncbi:MAG: hypothetical protein GWN01_08440 [Nitrosopumilaceae archaeon]|nr:hypothetical protein [Nitrosopumilaceae archaeon]NIU00942.1 hypothetical protein [Nitrosopumilaceae archaeon]NIU87400.1 hypothetical protein [Nitrosopumilaceae archaeon]NIV65922.1 hypothetical protein [Nitrosopumilaceae archaeon]NIX61544.1 hypothetical protein [Nitrosopumilaceae archaeon]
MSDTRFIILGVGLIFAGFLVLGIFGEEYSQSSIEANEFGDCYEYFEDKPPVPVECETKVFIQSLFFGFTMSLVGGGIISLVKGARGDWDQRLRPEDMLGPGGEDNVGDTSKKDEKK